MVFYTASLLIKELTLYQMKLGNGSMLIGFTGPIMLLMILKQLMWWKGESAFEGSFMEPSR